MANLGQRAFQIWPLLVFAAANRRILTYREVGDCTGMAYSGLGGCLERIHLYCEKHELPPLTILVVSVDTGLPGGGFHSIKIDSAESLAQAQRKVFQYDWAKHKPQLEDFE